MEHTSRIGDDDNHQYQMHQYEYKDFEYFTMCNDEMESSSTKLHHPETSATQRMRTLEIE